MKFMRKERIADVTLVDAIVRVESGLIDADLGGGLLKLRLARAGQGRSSGNRTIVDCRVGARAFFLVGYGKSDLDNIGDATLARLRRFAEELQRLTEDELENITASGAMREIER
jgi:hypothetical protein